MNDYEQTRRDFLTKLGLTLGTVAAGTAKLSATILNDKSEFPLTAEQQAFMKEYEQWMEEYIPAVVAQRNNPDDLLAKARVADLSHRAEVWQPKLFEYMNDENFARYYMAATERLTKEIY